MADGDVTIERTDDGRWAVVRDGEELSVHPREAGAEAERHRLVQATQQDGDSPAEYSADEGPYPDNVGS